MKAGLRIAAIIAGSLAAAAGGEEAATKNATTTQAAESEIVRGTDGWLFWTARRPPYEKEDPLAVENADVIVDFAAQLKSVGIKLIVVPIPDQLYMAREHWPDPKAPFVRTHLDKAFEVMRSKGVVVEDVVPLLEKLRAKGVKTAMTQDAHLMPASYEALAEEAAALVKKEVAIKGRPKDFTKGSYEAIEYATTAVKEGIPVLKLPVTVNRVRHATSLLVEQRQGAELMIMGDSHAIEWCPECASFSDHLAYDLAVVPDVRSRPAEGSGGSIRTDLARQHDNLEGTKVVVWIFLEGALTLDGKWKKVQVIKKE